MDKSSTIQHIDYPPTIIVRHRRENLKKCSLRGLEQRSDMCFFSYPISQHNEMWPQDLSQYFMLDLEAPPLEKSDAHLGLILLDGTWRLAQKMKHNLPRLSTLPCRSLPKQIRTAYPRRQEDCPDPEIGLASIEALYVAYFILGRNASTLLDHYYWKESFLEKNRDFLK